MPAPTVVRDEHAWHACTTPDPPTRLAEARWRCDTCRQVWIWRRPPRPTAQWIRATPEDN